jgi:hypothetical protein
MAAGPAPVDFAQTAKEPHHDVRVSMAAREKGEIVSNSGKPMDARAALAGALIGQITGYPGRLGETARLASEHHDHSDTGGGADHA